MKNTRKFVCALLAAALLVLTVAPAYAVSVDVSSPKIYLGSKDGSNWGYGEINIYDISASSKITDIKSTDNNVLGVSRLSRYTYSSEALDGDDDNYADSEASIGFFAKKKGKASITFKVDGEKYSEKIEVLAFANPIKNFTVAGISKTNLKSKFAKNSWYSAKLKKDAKAGALNISAASGWKLTSVEWYDDAEGDRIIFSYSKGVSSFKQQLPKMSKKSEYHIWLTFVNTKTQAKADFTYNIAG